MKSYKKNLVSVLVICFVLLLCSGIISMARQPEAPAPVKMYTSVQIESGDTLWALEKKYNTAGLLSRTEYIEELKSVNHLKGDSIHAGNFLTVLYYE
ncbi:MAG: LysM peptidoglycan-binding domain-containing protein [Lachnospiraceae bacterium]|nr:LysM peptidoglycan-binding domain-containing protein [Lachnospiraceae bacterium]